MKSLLFWLASALLVLGALSATVSMATVRWLYPESAAARAQPHAQLVAPPAPQTSPASGAAQTGQAFQLPPLRSDLAPPATPDENLALEVIRKAGAGDLSGARALTTAVPQQVLDALKQIAPSPYRAIRLPGPPDSSPQVLVWTQYRREGLTARGYYLVTTAAGKATAITGPFAPEKGYKPLPWAPFDERIRKIDLSPYQGRGLVLVAPRLPDPTLLPALAALQQQYSQKGVEFILVLDLLAPDWSAMARRAGFSGHIWRLKGKLEDVPVVTQGRLMGAAGLLIDRQGSVVASLAALDPTRYGLDGQGIGDISSQVLRAFGLLP